VNVTEQMRALSREKAILRKVGPKDPVTGQWGRALNRAVEPYHTERDRSLPGKARIRARRLANKAASA
jgi:hypothetical protein